MGSNSHPAGEATVLEALLDKEREAETLLLQTKAEAERVVERAREKARAITEKAQAEWRAHTEAVRQRLAEKAGDATDQRLASLEGQIQHLETLTEEQMQHNVRYVLGDIFPELAEEVT